MHIIKILINNFKQRRGRMGLCVGGIILATMTVFVLSLVSHNYALITKGFFQPFYEYNQVVERGTNYLQMLPSGSLLNQSIQSELENEFKVPVIPCLLKANDATSGSFYMYHIMGMSIEQIPTLWKHINLQSGRWPTNDTECVIGVNYLGQKTVDVGNRTLNVTGMFYSTHSFLDSFIVCDLKVLQSEINMNGLVTLFFIDRTVEKEFDKIISFEELHTNIDILTEQELNTIKGGLTALATDLTDLFSSLSSISALVFVFTIETINIMSYKKDIGIMKVLGASKKKIFQIFWTEVYLIIIIGVILGTPISFLTYSAIFSFIKSRALPKFTFVEYFKTSLNLLLIDFPYALFFRVISLLLIGGAILAIFPVLIALNVKPTEELKEKC